MTERRAVLLLALAAALRVLLFAAAFPPFDNVDEEMHFDLVLRYAHGEPPGKGLAPISTEASDTIARYHSTESLASPEGQPEAWRTPRWKRTDAAAAVEIEKLRAHWSSVPNLESHSPPLYYLLAGLWADAGRIFGIAGGALVYWIRFLNAALCAATVVLAHGFFVRHFPDRPLLSLGVPFLLAVLPQDVEYSINCDALSAPVAILALDRVLLWTSSERPAARLALASGLLLAAAMLVKPTNVFLVPVAAGVVALRRRGARETAIAAAAAGIPVLLWILRTSIVAGEPTGVGDKIASLGWTRKPLAELFDHPILTPAGAWAFLAPLIRTSWRGEFNWHGQRLASGFADGVYIASTVALSVAGAARLLAGSSRKAGGEREAAIACVAVPALAVLLLAALSMAFDFGDCFYPSREKPYFVSGRLLSGALVPFLGVYVAGVDLPLSGRARRVLAWTLLGLVAAVATASELWITAEVFRSPFNLYHGLGPPG